MIFEKLKNLDIGYPSARKAKSKPLNNSIFFTAPSMSI